MNSFLWSQFCSKLNFWQNLFKADISIKRTFFSAPMVSALEGFHCSYFQIKYFLRFEIINCTEYLLLHSSLHCLHIILLNWQARCLMRLSWIFGAMAFGDATALFQWLFAVFNSLKGLFVFDFHVLRNDHVIKE